MARRKAQSHPVPKTLAEATELASDYVAVDRRILEAQLSAEIAIDAIKAVRDAKIAEARAAQTSWFTALKAWWEAGGMELAGKKRSAELAGATLGIRRTPPAVKFGRGVKPDAIITWLKTSGWSKAADLVRTKVELDKAAIIKCVAESQGEEDLLAEQGVTVVQVDEFFIDTGLDPAAIRQTLES